jgi:hypothetical protein
MVIFDEYNEDINNISIGCEVLMSKKNKEKYLGYRRKGLLRGSVVVSIGTPTFHERIEVAKAKVRR